MPQATQAPIVYTQCIHVDENGGFLILTMLSMEP